MITRHWEMLAILIILEVLGLVPLLAVDCQQLLTLHNGETSRGSDPVCNQPNAVSCVQADINMTVIKTNKKGQLPDGSLLPLSWREGQSAVFKVH